MPDNGLIQKKDAHEMAHGRPVQITEHTTVTELQPSLSDVVCANKKLQIGFIVALVVLALLSGFVARPHFADTKTWDSTIEVIDQKKGNVLALTASCVALSAGITALPGDTGTPVAEQLAQLSGNLGIVLAVLYLEKYLLTILWSVGLGILIPFALALFAVSLGIHGRWSTSAVLRRVATRVLVVAVIGMALVPASVWVSQKVDETYRVSIEAAEQKAADAAGAADSDSSKVSKKKTESTESKNVLEQLADGASGLVTSVTSGAKQMTDEIVQQVETRNNVEALFFTDKQQVYKVRLAELEDGKVAQMGIFVPGRLGMDEGENILAMVITGDYSGFVLFFFASGKCAKIPLSSYATKQNRRKLLKAYCDKEPLAKLLYLPEETELAIRTSASRMLLVGTAQIAAKATRDSQGVAVVTLKKNQTIASVVPADTLELANPHRYRVRSLPATGALIRAEDEGEQMSLL